MNSGVNADVKFTGDSRDIEDAANNILKRLSALEGMFGKLDKTSEETLSRMVTGLNKALKAATNGKDLEVQIKAIQRFTREYERLLGTVHRFGSLNPLQPGRLSYLNDIRDNQARHAIRNINSTPEQVQARVIQAELAAFARSLKTTTAMVNASVAQLTREASRANNSTYQNALNNRERFNQFRTTAAFGDDEYAALQRRVYARNLQQTKLELADLELQTAKYAQRRRRNEKLKETAFDTEAQAAQEKIRAANREINIIRSGNAGESVSRATRRASPEYRAAARAADVRSENRLIRQNQVGVHGEMWENRLGMLAHNNGADLLAVQSRILVGYQALSMAFQTARGMSQFVVELDKEFKQFQAITNTTAGEMESVRKELIKVSEATKFTALEVAQAATVLGQAGMSASNVRESIEAITLLATASGSTLNEAVDTVTSTLSIFNLQAGQATEISNTFTAALNESKLSMDRITLGLQYAGNTAAQFGVSYQELTALLGAMANSGIRSGSTLGTGLRQLMVDLEQPTKKFRAQLAVVGLTTKDVDIQSKGLVNVLTSLKEAGFGAAEAYGSFEVRAAAAYSAIANNLDLAHSLEESFIGSTAALKANEVQMQSLANTWDKFKSVMGTIAYDTFSPLVTTLQQVIDTLANMMSVLREVPVLLNVVGIAVAGIGAVIATQTGGVVLRGVLGGLPIFSSLSKEFKEFGAAAAVAGGKVNVLKNAMSALITVAKANWIGVFVGLGVAMVTAYNALAKANWIGVVVGLGAALFAAYNALAKANWIGVVVGLGVAMFTAYNAFANKLTEAEAQLKALETLASRSKQSFETLKQEASAMDQAISNLKDRQESLDSNPLQRKLKIDETLAQFKELNGVIDSNTSSVGDLVEALENLRDVNLTRQIEELRTLAETQKLAAKGEEQVRRQEDPYRALGRAYLREFIPESGGVRNSMTPRSTWLTPEQAMQGSLGQRLSTAGVTAQQQASVQGVLSAIYDQAGAARNLSLGTQKAQLDNLIRSLQQEQIDLKGQQGAKTAPKDVEDRLAALASAQTFLESLSTLSNDTVDSILRQQKFEADSRSNDQLAKLTEIKQDVEQYVGENFREKIEKNFEVIVSAYTAALEDPTLSEGEVLYAALSSKIDDLKKIEERWVEDMATSLNISPGDAQNLFDQTQSGQKMVKIFNDANTLLAAKAEVLGQGRQRLAKEEIKRLDAELKLVQRNLSNTSDSGGILEARKRLAQLHTAREVAAEELLAAELENAEYRTDQSAIETDALERRRLDKEAADQRVEAADQKLSDIRQKNADMMVDLTQTAIDNLNEQIDQAIDALGNATSESEANAIKARIDKLKSQLVGYMDNILGWLGDANTENTGGDSFFTRMFGSESGGNFGAVNSLGYTGRVQFGTDRWSEVRRMIGADGVSLQQMGRDETLQRRAEIAHFGDIQNRIRKDSDLLSKMGTSIAGTPMDMGAMMGMAHLGGFSGMRSYVTTGGRYNPKDAYGTSLSDYAHKFSGTNTDLLGYYNSEQSEQSFQNSKDLREIADKLTKSSAEFLENERTAVVKAASDAVDEARLKLEVAQKDGSYTQQELDKLQKGVDDAEKAQRVKELAAAERQLRDIKKQQAEAVQQYGQESSQAVFWAKELKDTEAEVLALRKINSAYQTARGPGNPLADGAAALVAGSSYYDPATSGLKDESQQVRDAWAETFSSLNGGVYDFFMSWGDGFESIGASLRDFGLSFTKMIMSLIAKALALRLVMSFADSLGGTPLGGALSEGLKLVGAVPGAAVGEYINTGIPGRDSTLRRVEPGEMILRRSAVTAIGKDRLVELNNMGSRRNSVGTTVADTPRDGDKSVNVYVVSPDQKPQMSPNDILVTLSDDIQNRGSTYRLIKQVNMGAI